MRTSLRVRVLRTLKRKKKTYRYNRSDKVSSMSSLHTYHPSIPLHIHIYSLRKFRFRCIHLYRTISSNSPRLRTPDRKNIRRICKFPVPSNRMGTWLRYHMHHPRIQDSNCTCSPNRFHFRCTCSYHHTYRFRKTHRRIPVTWSGCFSCVCVCVSELNESFVSRKKERFKGNIRVHRHILRRL